MKKEKVLIIGSGGREHAIAHKLIQSPLVSEVFVCPGNPGMTRDCKDQASLKLVDIKASDIHGILNFAKKENIDLSIVGPEAILSLGIVDLFRDNQLAIVGSTLEASKLETSKAFAKKIMMEAQVPTALYQEFFNAEAAIDYIQSSAEEKMVVKCDGLAAGKGVVVCSTKLEAIDAVNALMKESLLGENVNHIIIEDFLEGVEVSAFALCDKDGESFSFLGTACDHKRLRDGDLGPNTGGMGVFSPASVFDTSDEVWVNQFVFAPMLKTMKDKGVPFSGILFAGLMKTKLGWKVLEFNVRFGDPETQVLMPLIEEDMFPWFKASAFGELKKLKESQKSASPKKKNLVGVHVVMAAFGYPGTEGITIRSGDKIEIDKINELVKDDFIYFAGVAESDHQLQTSGGRVLGVTSLSKNFKEARKNAYDAVSHIHFEGAQYRSDIGISQES
jgi:phosphoribosylamine--glycine ligase